MVLAACLAAPVFHSGLFLLHFFPLAGLLTWWLWLRSCLRGPSHPGPCICGPGWPGPCLCGPGRPESELFHSG